MRELEELQDGFDALEAGAAHRAGDSLLRRSPPLRSARCRRSE
jgi:hypothetical protein